MNDFIANALVRLKAQSKDDSEYAESILKFWGLGPEHRFSVHGYVFKKGMNVADYLHRVTSAQETPR